VDSTPRRPPVQLRPHPAWGADVVSSNIVGYEKISLSEGFNMIGVQFNTVGGGTLDLATVGQLAATMPGFDEDGNYDTTMRVWNGNGYDTYGWSGTSGTDYAEDPTLDNKWLDFSTMETVSTPIPYGTAVWIKAGTAGSITFSAPSAGN